MKCEGESSSSSVYLPSRLPPPHLFSCSQQLLITPCRVTGHSGASFGWPPYSSSLTHSHLVSLQHRGQEWAANNNRSCQGLMKRLWTASGCRDPVESRPRVRDSCLKIINGVPAQWGHGQVVNSQRVQQETAFVDTRAERKAIGCPSWKTTRRIFSWQEWIQSSDAGAELLSRTLGGFGNAEGCKGIVPRFGEYIYLLS